VSAETTKNEVARDTWKSNLSAQEAEFNQSIHSTSHALVADSGTLVGLGDSQDRLQVPRQYLHWGSEKNLRATGPTGFLQEEPSERMKLLVIGILLSPVFHAHTNDEQELKRVSNKHKIQSVV
jgi:hypothetical protein